MRFGLMLFFLCASLAQAKPFQNSYVAFEVPDDWSCIQEGVAWTCTPRDPAAAKEAVIVLVAKVAGPADNNAAFLAFLKTPKNIVTKMGTPAPSHVMYAQERMVAGHTWIQAQHLGSEIQDYYTVYLATVKNQLAFLVNFSAEKSRYQLYNPIFEKAIRTLKIVTNNQLLFPKNQMEQSAVIGIQVQGGPGPNPDMLPPPEHAPAKPKNFLIVLIFLVLIIGSASLIMNRRKSNSGGKNRKSRSK